MTKENSLVDHLKDRGLIDQYGFVLFAAIGIAAILVSKAFNAPVWIIAVGACVIMLAYAVVVNMRGTGKLRSDQAGDNCYYLGLLFTLTSLGYAIFTFDPADTATTIVQGFGIALATTIFGLMLRVFFNQSRVDLYEVEDSARLELAEAAGALKTELSDVTLSFKSFTLGLQQSLEEVSDETKESILSTTGKVAESLENMTSIAVESLTNYSEHLAENQRTFVERSDEVAASLLRHKQWLEAVADAQETMLGKVEKMAEASDLMVANSAVAAEQLGTAAEIQERVSSSMDNLNSAVMNTQDKLINCLERLNTIEHSLVEQLEQLKNAPKDTADRALSAIANAAQAVEGAMEKLVDAQVSSVGEVETATEGLLNTIKQHNASLETELGRSRDNVQKVHASLVDMTNKLNESLK